MATNPFHDLYLTEAISANRFVELFSPDFVRSSLSLFEPGNVVLRGLQGSGKTMLLNLLKPDIRIAYHRVGVDFPVPKSNSKFLSAGINLRKSGIMDFGQLVEENSTKRDIQEFALQFADFVNYWLVSDLLQSVKRFCEEADETLLKCVGITASEGALGNFVRLISDDPCWFGYLHGVDGLDGLLGRVNERILIYRKLVNLNILSTPKDISDSKTVIGNPLIKVVDALRKAKVLDHDTQIYVRIDQYEQLPTLNVAGHEFGTACQELIHKALAARDPRISYRIGTRHYAWPNTPKLYGTNDTLEHKRDYSRIDIDEKLRRHENPGNWIFPSFAQDIFIRRIAGSEYSQFSSKTALKLVFGDGLAPDEKAKAYAANEDSRIATLQLEDDMPADWAALLRRIAIQSPLSAKLGVAWVRQIRTRKGAILGEPSEDMPYPWETKAKEYWKKERIDQALLQIASSNKQQPIWCGKDDILALSGGNILVFLSLCQHIWDAWLRGSRFKSPNVLVPPIESYLQSQGIIEAGDEWFKKQTEGHDAVRRRSFVRTLGQHFYTQLTSDRKMSYPGHIGFSVNSEELEAEKDVSEFLHQCVDYGDLHEAEHTSKTKGEKRTKFYLAPVLTPYFKIPYKKNKEPEYVRVSEVREWIFPEEKSHDAPLAATRQFSFWEGEQK